jgi:hypothetical protein
VQRHGEGSWSAILDDSGGDLSSRRVHAARYCRTCCSSSAA